MNIKKEKKYILEENVLNNKKIKEDIQKKKGFFQKINFIIG